MMLAPPILYEMRAFARVARRTGDGWGNARAGKEAKAENEV
jgi:hypothetical protein